MIAGRNMQIASDTMVEITLEVPVPTACAPYNQNDSENCHDDAKRPLFTDGPTFVNRGYEKSRDHDAYGYVPKCHANIVCPLTTAVNGANS